MKKYMPYAVAFGLVTIWGFFAYAYLGVEDGSSGLSPLGYVHLGFFLPGLYVFRVFNSSYTNSNIPLIAAISWLIYTILALAAAHATIILRRQKRP